MVRLVLYIYNENLYDEYIIHWNVRVRLNDYTQYIHAYIQPIVTVLILKMSNGVWHGKKHIELIKSAENQLVQACRDINTVRPYSK